jgi:pre-60S factor REI1
MESAHGFYLPDREYLTDARGLLSYLGEKVGIGHVCLYCQKGFSSRAACQQHMLDSAHAKLLYDADLDFPEYEDFYDFSSSWAGVKEASDGADALADRRIEVDRNGELRLEDGRLVGHREYRRVYRQAVRPEDNRESVVANLRSIAERVLGKDMAAALVQARLTDMPHEARLAARQNGGSRRARCQALMGLSPMQLQAVKKQREVRHKAIAHRDRNFFRNRARVQWNQNKLNLIGQTSGLFISWKK